MVVEIDRHFLESIHRLGIALDEPPDFIEPEHTVKQPKHTVIKDTAIMDQPESETSSRASTPESTEGDRTPTGSAATNSPEDHIDTPYDHIYLVGGASVLGMHQIWAPKDGDFELEDPTPLGSECYFRLKTQCQKQFNIVLPHPAKHLGARLVVHYSRFRTPVQYCGAILALYRCRDDPDWHWPCESWKTVTDKKVSKASKSDQKTDTDMVPESNDPGRPNLSETGRAKVGEYLFRRLHLKLQEKSVIGLGDDLDMLYDKLFDVAHSALGKLKRGNLVKYMHSGMSKTYLQRLEWLPPNDIDELHLVHMACAMYFNMRAMSPPELTELVLEMVSPDTECILYCDSRFYGYEQTADTVLKMEKSGIIRIAQNQSKKLVGRFQVQAVFSQYLQYLLDDGTHGPKPHESVLRLMPVGGYVHKMFCYLP